MHYYRHAHFLARTRAHAYVQAHAFLLMRLSSLICVSLKHAYGQLGFVERPHGLFGMAVEVAMPAKVASWALGRIEMGFLVLNSLSAAPFLANWWLAPFQKLGVDKVMF